MNIEGKVKDFLFDIISIESISRNEKNIILYLYKEFKEIADECYLHEVDDSLMDDPDYAFKLEDSHYNGRQELECIFYSENIKRKKIIFNTHVDTVPPIENQKKPFSPYMENGFVYGRGACDAKGQIAVLFYLALAIKEKKIKINNELRFHFVFEEEIGGNGTLVFIRKGIKSDVAVVLEPTDLKLITAVRGAVWFLIEVFGKAGHSGQSKNEANALKGAIKIITLLEEYHNKLLNSSRGNPLFDKYDNPMPVNFGELVSGDWPSTVPSKAILKGVFGFLPNKTRFEVQNEIKNFIFENVDVFLKENIKIHFPMLNSDGYIIPAESKPVLNFQNILRINGLNNEITAMTASCDAWLYNNRAKIPTIVFGPGSINVAHSEKECIFLNDIYIAAKVLEDFVETFS